MSVCANIYCLFGSQPTPERVPAIQTSTWDRPGENRREEVLATEYGHLVEPWQADTDYSFSPDGSITRLSHPSIGPLFGEPSLEGRFYGIHYLTRWWNVDIPEGPLPEYVVTMLTLLAQQDIEGVWYAPDGWQSMSRVTKESALALLDEYVQIRWKESNKGLGKLCCLQNAGPLINQAQDRRMLNKLIIKFVHWYWKTFRAPILIQSLRAQGKVKVADALERLRRQPAPNSQGDMVQSTVNKLLAQGRMDDAMKLKEMAQKVKHWQKHGGKRPW